MNQSKQKYVYIEHGSSDYTLMFIKLGYIVTHDVSKADLVCFTGGSDVSPSLYASAKHQTTWNDEWRDTKEQRLFDELRERNIPMVGICRGGQFLNVMSGGSMYQDVSKHTCSHSITDLETGDVIWVSSTHHQMMKPSSSGVLVASSNLGGKREWYEGTIFKRDVSEEDIEVVFYPDTNCLCFQPHPEFTGETYEKMFTYFGECLKKYLFKESS